MTQGTIQPDEAAGYDTIIRADQATTNYGTVNYLEVGELMGGVANTTRTLIKFDVSSIPSASQVNAGTLYLTVMTDAASLPGTIQAYKVLRNWVETQATWNIFSTGNNWGTAGCSGIGTDRENTNYVTSGGVTTATDAAGSVIPIGLSPTILQEWVTGIANNYGLLLKQQAEAADDGYLYHSSAGTTTSYRPTLIIDYTLNGSSFQALLMC